MTVNHRVIGGITAFAIAAMLGIAALYLVLDPDSTLADFSALDLVLARTDLIRKEEGKTDFFELWLHGEAGEALFMREPEDTRLRAYLAAIPIGRAVQARYTASADGNRLVDLRDASVTYVALADVLAGEAGKRRLILLFAGVFAAIGAVAIVVDGWTRRRRRRAERSRGSAA